MQTIRKFLRPSKARSAAGSKAVSDAIKASVTPGPWEFRVYAEGCTVVSKHDQPGRSVRQGLRGVSVKVAAHVRDDQSNAREASTDARLIVAAPDLLDVCEAIVTAFEGNHFPTDTQKHVLDGAKAAIAKVRG